MGDATRKAKAAVPQPEQPVPEEKLKALYVEQVEVENAKLRAQMEVNRVVGLDAAFKAKLDALAPDIRDWELNLKLGTMVRKVRKHE